MAGRWAWWDGPQLKLEFSRRSEHPAREMRLTLVIDSKQASIPVMLSYCSVNRLGGRTLRIKAIDDMIRRGKAANNDVTLGVYNLDGRPPALSRPKSTKTILAWAKVQNCDVFSGMIAGNLRDDETGFSVPAAVALPPGGLLEDGKEKVAEIYTMRHVYKARAPKKQVRK